MTEKQRLDTYLVENNIAPTREKAKALIMSGQIYIDDQKADKAGTIVKDGQKVELRGKGLKYVSRGGLKLEKAIKEFDISLKDKVCMDIGASTGGFTDCMLQNGAAKVYSVDVGYGQLAWSLRTDERVVNMERTNIRYLTREQLDSDIDFASIDVSFISLKLVLPVVSRILTQDGTVAALIKPQFEAGREQVGKKGVVRDKNVHTQVVEQVLSFAKETGLYPQKLSYSPIKGPEGNIEYLVYLAKTEAAHDISTDDIKNTVEASHSTLDA